MKKKLFLAGAILVMSAATVVGYKVYNQSRMSAFMKANIEALTRAESSEEPHGSCYNNQRLSCVYTCPKCGGVWAQLEKDGPIKSISGTCTYPYNGGICGEVINFRQ